MAKGEAIGTLFVEIKAEDNVTKELDKIKKDAGKAADGIEKEFKDVRLSFRTDLMKKNLGDIKKEHQSLKAELEKKIKTNVNYKELELTKIKLDETTKALSRFGKEAEEAGDKADKTFFARIKESALGLAVAGAAMGAFFFLKGSVEAFFESEKAAASLKQQLGYTSDALNEYAGAIQNTTVYEDDLVIAAMTRIAAFTKDEDQIKALTTASLDLAAAKGMDLVSAADLVAKTFGSETNALGRQGIQVDAVAGSTERLTQVTKGISDLYAGQASAQAQTYGGKVEILKNKFGDLREEIGKKLAPTIAGLSDYFAANTDNMKKSATAGKSLGSVFDWIAFAGVALISSVKIIVIALGGMFASIIAGVNVMIQGLELAVVTIQGIGSIIGKLIENFKKGDFIINVDSMRFMLEAVTTSYRMDLNKAITTLKNIDNLTSKDIKAVMEEAKAFRRGQLKAIEDANKEVETKPLGKEKDEKDASGGKSEAQKQDIDKRLEKTKDYYDMVKWEDKDYLTFLEGQWKIEADEFEKTLGKKFDRKLYYENKEKEADIDYYNWKKSHLSQTMEELSKIEEDKGLEKGYFKAMSSSIKEETFQGEAIKPLDYKKKEVKGGSKDGIEGLKDFSSLEALKLFTEQTVLGKLAWDDLGGAVSQTLGLIRIRFADDASDMEKIWGGMVNGMIDKLSQLVAQWLLFNTIAMFLPGANSVSFTSLLGLPGAKEGGTFLGTNGGIVKLAMGGSFTVPQGYANDSYPMLVQSGERVKVTPSGKVGDDVRLLSEIKNAIEANTLDRRMVGSRPIIVQPKITLGERELTKQVSKTDIKLAREGFKKGA